MSAWAPTAAQGTEEKDYKEPPPAPLFEAEVLLPRRDRRVRGHLPVPLRQYPDRTPPPPPNRRDSGEIEHTFCNLAPRCSPALRRAVVIFQQLAV
jgi:hypothetical protein